MCSLFQHLVCQVQFGSKINKKKEFDLVPARCGCGWE
jgi:hypothetical protein